MKPVENLEKLRVLLTPAENFTQKTYAQDKDGCDSDPLGSTATCFCTVGGLLKTLAASDSAVTVNNITFTPEYTFLERVASGIRDKAWPDRRNYPGSRAVVDVNDNLGHGKTLYMIQSAIELAKTELSKSTEVSANDS